MKKIYSLMLVLLALCLVGCGGDNGGDDPVDTFTIKITDTTKLNASIDIYQTTYAVVKLSDYVTASNLEGLTFTAKSVDTTAVTVSSVQADSSLSIFSQGGKLGDYNINVAVVKDEVEVLNFVIKVSVVDGAPDPTVIKEIETQNISAPEFIDGSTNVEYRLNLADYFDAADSITYSMTCDDATVSMTIPTEPENAKMATLHFTSFGAKNITINALKNNVVIVSSSFVANLTASAPNQLINGDFESNWTGWDIDEWGKLAYSLYDSPFDIWGNNVNGTGTYLYGYYNESGTTEFTSSMFTVGGTGLITFKMSGNSTDDLKLKLMQYNAEGDDTEVAVFNNWYYGKYAASGFIFRDYFYQIDLATYNGAKMYFVVVDNRTSDFGFICLDDIVTYHTSAINEDDYYQAGYLTDPSGNLELDYTDTSATPFPTDLTTVPTQLANGDFEKGYDNWYMTEQNKKDYAIYDSKTDIWSNPVNATKHYLYGYQNEAAVCEFHSSLFKVSGTGLITFKIAGNSTADLQFKLMAYNPDGDDTEVAVFNNWYFPISQESGFIFRQYYYQIDLATYENQCLYFVVKDARGSDFGFICLDDIVTYYATTIDLTDYRKAGHVTDPDA